MFRGASFARTPK
jgi:hypothetical protein